MATFRAYQHHLLPALKQLASEQQHENVKQMKKHVNVQKTIHFIKKQKYKNKDKELEENGFKIVKNVFENPHEIDYLNLLAESYDLSMHEFADKDVYLKDSILPFLTNEKFIEETEKIYQTPFLWQNVTIYRKTCLHNLLLIDTHRSTCEHVDITETPNSALTITSYIALTDQDSYRDSRLMVYPKTHLLDLRVPVNNFDYLTQYTEEFMDVITDLNEKVLTGETESWMVDCLYYLIELDSVKYNVLKSTMLLLAYNPDLVNYKPEFINLRKGDIVYFTSDLVYSASSHSNNTRPIISLAVRGGYPYHEHSNLISRCVTEEMYKELGENLERNKFLFSGTQSMIKKLKMRDMRMLENLIYEI